MDIDHQDELIDYEDGDALMGAQTDAEVIIVEEGDAEMIDEENLDENDTSMMDDAAAMTLASTAAIVEEETEIDMQPAEEENDDDTPMREDIPEEMREDVAENTNDIGREQDPAVASTSVSETAPWPPAPTDVPPVPSLLPSALAVPQEARHEEGKIHDGAIQNSSPLSVVAEPAAVPSDLPVEPTIAQFVAFTDAEETQSNAVEPAVSVRGSDIGTIHEDRNGTATAATSVHEGDVAESEAGKETGKWPPAPTEVPAVPSMLPSVLAVPDVSAEADHERPQDPGLGEEASVIAEPAGSVRAGEAPREIDVGVNGERQEKEDGTEEVINSGAEKKVIGDVNGEDTHKEEQTAEPARVDNGTVADDSKGAIVDPPQSDEMPIVLVISNVHYQPLFAPLPADIEYESDEPIESPILAGMAVDLYGAALSEIFQGLRDALAHGDDAFSVKRGKELVLEQQELSLRLGEDNKYAGEITLQEIVQLYRDCNGEAPMVLHLHHDSPRFIEWYKMTRAFADNLQHQQREEHEDSEYDEQEEAGVDAEENGDESAEINEGETVYVDAEEEDLGVDVDVEEYEFDEEGSQQFEDVGEAEEDELALDHSDGAVPGNTDQLGVNQADRGATEEIVDYEDELVVIEAPAAENEEASPEEDQFGVDAAIHAAEREASVVASPAADSTIPEAAAKTEDSPSAKRSRDEEEPNEAERQVKRKLSDAGGAAVGQVHESIPVGGEATEAS